MREQEFTKEKTCIAIHDKNVRCCESWNDPAIDPAMAGEVGKVGRIISPHRRGMGEGFLFGIPPYSLPLFPLAWCAFALLAIVRLLCQLPRVIIADAQSKRLIGPYKRRLTYQVRPMGQDGATSANQLSVRTGGRDRADRDSGTHGERGRTGQRTGQSGTAHRNP